MSGISGILDNLIFTCAVMMTPYAVFVEAASGVAPTRIQAAERRTVAPNTLYEES